MMMRNALPTCLLFASTALILALAGCGQAPIRPTAVAATAVPMVQADAVDPAGDSEMVASLASDPRCRCLYASADLASPPVMRHGQLELRLNPGSAVEIAFPSSPDDTLRVSASMLVVVFDLSEGVPKVRTLRLLGAPAAIRDAAGEMMVISPRIVLDIGAAGILSVDIDPAGTIKRIPGA